MIKGIGILFVVVFHMISITTLTAPDFVVSLGTPVMLIFFMFAGYTTTIKSESLIVGQRLLIVLVEIMALASGVKRIGNISLEIRKANA